MYRALCSATVLGVCLAGLGLPSFADDNPAAGQAQGHAEQTESAAADHGGAGQDAGEHGDVGHQTAGAGEGHAGEHLDGDGHGEHGEGHGASHGNTNPLSVDPDLVIFTFLAFGLTYVVMSKFAWKPICAALDKREAWMASQLEAARQRDEECERLRKQHADQLSGANEQVRAVLEQSRKDADREKQSILEAAQAEAAAEKQQALAAIGAARGDALQDLAGTSVDTAVELAGRIVGRPLNRDDHSGLIDETVNQFKTLDT